MDLPNPGIEPGSLAWQADSLPTELSGKPDPYLKTIFAIREVEQKNVGGGVLKSAWGSASNGKPHVLTAGWPVLQCGPTVDCAQNKGTGVCVVGTAHSSFLFFKHKMYFLS